MEGIVNAYNMIVGKIFSQLTTEELSVVYAVELWKDGMDSNQVHEIFKLKDHLLIKLQLKNTFGYEDFSIIQDI